MILGHAALAGAARRTFFGRESVLYLLLAGFGPDLVDKPAMLLLGSGSKGWGHSLLCLALAMAVFKAWPGLRSLAAGGLLWLSHLLLDLTDPVVLLWPLLGPLPETAPYNPAEGFVRFYSGNGSIPILILDLACIALWLALEARARRRAAAAA